MTSITPTKIWQLQYTNCFISRTELTQIKNRQLYYINCSMKGTELTQKLLATTHPKQFHKQDCNNPRIDWATTLHKLLKKPN